MEKERDFFLYFLSKDDKKKEVPARSYDDTRIHKCIVEYITSILILLRADPPFKNYSSRE